MTEEKKGRKPDFSSDGVAVWINQSKDGLEYVTIQLFGKNGIKLAAFKPTEEKK